MHLIDLHNDAITSLSEKQFSKYVQKAKRAGVEAIFMSVWTTRMEEPVGEIKQYIKFSPWQGRGGTPTGEWRTTVPRAKRRGEGCGNLLLNVDIPHTPSSLRDATPLSQEGNLLFHIEDAWFLSEENIDELIALQPFSVGLTWNDDNPLAGGAYGMSGVTPLGKNIVIELVANDIVIDLAHLNRRSFYEVAEMLKGEKLFCSHTCFDEVHPHPRNLDRKQVATIVNSGGLIGLTLVGDFLGGITMEYVYNHIKWFIDNFGDRHLAIGTDFFGTDNLPKGLKRYKDFRRFKRFLLSKGLTRSQINNIFYYNAKDFLDSYIGR